MTTARLSADDAYNVDPNEAAKETVAMVLGEIPEVGVLLETLTKIFWPAKDNDVWDQIEQKVEALIRRDLSELVYEQTQEDLTGLMNVLSDYTEYAQSGHTPAQTSEHWTAAQEQFNASLPHFQAKGYEVLLLPLWAQAANMHLGLLRDGVLFGRTWGWNDTDYNSALKSLQNAIKDCTAWAPRIFALGMADALGQAGVSYHNCQPFRGGNDYRQQMMPAVLDLAARWPCFDPTAYPPPVSPDDLYLSREIYTDPVGTADDSGLFILPWQHPTQPISQLTVWSGTLIDAIQVSYPAGGGPDKVTQTARMGSPTGGSSNVVTVTAGNPVVAVRVWAGDVIQGLSFTFKDGSTSAHFGGTGGTRTDISFYDQDKKTGQILSSIYINGTSKYYQCADAAVFGFQDERSPANP